jgi:hypothetical protein
MTARARLRAQGLGERRPRDPHDAVAGALAIQAQDTRASRLGVRARSEGLTRDDVVRACSEERSVVRTWAMRGTLHMLAAEDVRWVLGVLGPSVERPTFGAARTSASALRSPSGSCGRSPASWPIAARSCAPS